MEVSYKNKNVKEYCENYRTALSFFGNEKIAKKLAILMTDLKLTPRITDFAKVAKLQKYSLHDLVGDKAGIKSLKVDYAYRMELEVLFYAEDDGDQDKIIILEVNKHYGK